MKTIKLASGLLVAAAILFTACDSDRDNNPVIDTNNMTSDFVLNTPEDSTQTIDLANKDTLDFTWNQPNYGFTAAATYVLQISLDNTWTEEVTDDEGNVTTVGTCYTLPGTYTTVKGASTTSDFNKGVVKLGGWEKLADVPASQKVYVRCKSNLASSSVPTVYSNTVTINVKPSLDVAPSYAKYIYEIGDESTWATSFPMCSAAQDGIYISYNYLNGGFKFKPNSGDWDGDYGQNPTGEYGDLIVDGEENCNNSDGSFPNEVKPAGFYQIKVDLTKMKWSIVAIEHISIIGTVNGNWDADTDMSYNTETRAWETTTTLSAGIMKFRMNHDWTYNWGGDVNNLIQDGDNISIDAAGTYKIQLYISCEGYNKVVITKQ